MVFEFFIKLENMYKYKLLLLMIPISKITSINSKELIRKLICFGNEITIRIRGKGEHTFIFEDKEETIQSIYINNILFEKPDSDKPYNNKIDLEDGDNFIKVQFYSEGLQNLNHLFENCINITEIDLSNFNSSLKDGMYHMFYKCTSLTSINFNNFNTSSITNMEGIFTNCINLSSLNLSNFDTSQVTTMYQMFSGCNNLISLNLSNFNTSLVKNVEKMFVGCNNLISLNLSNFYFSEGVSTHELFKDCNNITTLDLTNITISEKTPLNNIAANFEKLKYLIFKN